MKLRTIDSEYVQSELAACYLRVQEDEAAFIETNTARAVPRLLHALEAEGLSPEQVRWVIVTHVHLDHAGGASALLSACPNATLVAHPRAARHLIDPARLVASATAVYGADVFDAMYGSIEPVPERRVRVVEDGDEIALGTASFRFLHTRGHANHHFVVHDPARSTVYTGDTFGLVYPQLQRGGRLAFASTSPTDFDAAEARRSIERILALDTRSVCLTHFGEYEDRERIASQLLAWIDRSERLVEEAVGLEPDDAERHIRDGLEIALQEAVRSAGVELRPADRSLLELDLALNAQGLAWTASKRR
jgi:glyoxylase-like metal-dependent hydrolase (beta-lactamase superfamily II)